MQEIQVIPSLPTEGFVDIKDILGDKKTNPPTPGVLPISSSSWWEGVKKGKYPTGIRHGRRRFWDVKQIRELLNKIRNGELA